NQAVRIQGNRIILPKLKNGVRFKGLPKEYNNQEIAQITVSMKNNRYYASIIFLKIIVLRKNSTGRGLGLDWSERECFSMISTMQYI
ncbi:MAG: hypothetical protein LBB45_08705, partial [Methanobrevibacter sp.]|nr:hypothetical protein [Candidatus Methanovirga basalitermitum]